MKKVKAGQPDGARGSRGSGRRADPSKMQNAVVSLGLYIALIFLFSDFSFLFSFFFCFRERRELLSLPQAITGSLLPPWSPPSAIAASGGCPAKKRTSFDGSDLPGHRFGVLFS